MRGIIENLSELSDSKEMLHMKPPAFGIVFIYLLMAILCAGAIWSYFGEVDIVVKAKGIVRPQEGISTLTSKSSGKITSLNFKNGDKVKTGDIIMILENDSLLVNQESMEKEYMKIKRERDLSNRFLTYLTNGTNGFNPSSEADYYQRFSKYLMDVDKIESTIEGLENKIKRLEEELKGQSLLIEAMSTGTHQLENQPTYKLMYQDYCYTLKSLQVDYENQLKQLEIQNDLYQAGTIPFNEFQNAQIKVDGALLALEKFKNESSLSANQNLEHSNQALVELRIELDKLKPKETNQSPAAYLQSEMTIALHNAIKDYDNQISILKGSLEKNKLEIQNSVIKSEIGGIINFNQYFATGDVVHSGLEIGKVLSPTAQNFQVQLQVLNRDIRQLQKHDTVKFRLDALPYKEYGTLEGHITYISSDSILDTASGISYYTVEASIENKPLKSYKNKEAHIKVGMTLEGHVITQRKKILWHLLELLNLM